MTRKRKTLAARTQFTLKMPPDMKVRLRQIAKANHRNLSQEIRWALNEYIDQALATAKAEGRHLDEYHKGLYEEPRA